MTNPKLTIVSISAEVAPYSKTGGLGDVAAALPKSFQRLKQRSIIITPYYRQLIDEKKYGLKKIISDLPLVIDDSTTINVGYYQAEIKPGLPIYFVAVDALFGKSKKIYTGAEDNARFYIFQIAALELIKQLKLKPEILHCHDWHTGLIPELLKKRYKNDLTFADSKTVFTIHNLNFQLGQPWWEIPGKQRDNGRTPLPTIKDKKFTRVNFAKRGILYADAINTVSETYREEIMQKKLGQDLHRILQNRKDRLFGVVNGIDYREFNPSNDPGLKATYDYHNASSKKKINKQALQKLCGFEVEQTTPLLVMSSRVTEQKGLDLLLPVVPYLLRKNIQLIIQGDGDKKYLDTFRQWQKDHPRHFRLISFKEQPDLETSLYAGGDMLLLPSRFEPCGINQLKSLRYGCVPIVREVGGLGETVSNFDPQRSPEGIGFVFTSYHTSAFVFALARAIETFKYPDIWKAIVIRGMRTSFSWDLPAAKYLKLFGIARETKVKK
jgi:starch synthase